MRSCGLKDATILEAEAKAQGAIGPVFFMWEFPKIRGYLIWGPYNQDPTIYGAILGSPIFGNSHVTVV